MVKKINLVIVVITLVAFVCPQCSPTFLGAWPALLSYAIPALIILNILFLIYWVVQSDSKLLLSLVTVLCGFFYLQSLFSIASPSTSQDSNLRVLSMNVMEFNVFPNKEFKNGAHLQTFLQLFDSSEADVILLQEAMHYGGLKSLNIIKAFDTLGYKYIASAVRPEQFAAATYSGSLIISKFPIVHESASIKEQDTKQIVTAIIKHPKGDFMVSSARLSSVQLDTRSSAWQALIGIKNSFIEHHEELQALDQQQLLLKQAYRLARPQNTKPLPIVVGIDTNELPMSSNYQALRKKYHVVFEEYGSFFGGTYKPLGAYARVDNQLYKGEIRAKSMRQSPLRSLSDHEYLLCTYRL